MTSHPSARLVSALRARMIEDMRVRGFSEKTRNNYIRNVRAFAAFVSQSPDTARRLTVVREPRRLPAVLSVEEVTLLLRAAPGPKYKAAFATAGACPRAGQRPDPWGAGLRVSEAVALKTGDVDSERMLLRVEQGKGRKDRHAMLSPQLLELLHWKIYYVLTMI